MDQIRINFLRFNSDNPHVYKMFDTFAKQMLARGYDHGSASLIFERMRWELMMTTTSALKLNNNYRSRYSRMWERRNPQHKGFFRTRTLAPASADSTWKAFT